MSSTDDDVDPRPTRSEARANKARQRALHPERSQLLGGGALGAFGEMLLIGLVISVLSLPVLTLLPALAAGSAHYERHLAAETTSVRRLLADYWRVLRTGWWVGALASGVLVALVANSVLGLSGALPFGTVYGVVSLVLTAAVGVLVLRLAGAWASAVRSPQGQPATARDWRDLVSEAFDDSLADLPGTALLLVGIGTAAVVIWMLPPLAVIAPGMLVIAVVSVERRGWRRAS